MAKAWYNKKIIGGITPITAIAVAGGLYYLRGQHSAWHGQESNRSWTNLDILENLKGGLAGLGHAIPHKHGLHVHTGKSKRGRGSSKKMRGSRGDAGRRFSRELPLTRGRRSASRRGSKAPAKKGIPSRRRRKPRKSQLRSRATVNPNFKRRTKKAVKNIRDAAPINRFAVTPLEPLLPGQERIVPRRPIAPGRGTATARAAGRRKAERMLGLGMTTSTSTTTSSSHIPDLMRRNNEANWNYRDVASGDIFGIGAAVPQSIRNRVGHSNVGSSSYSGQIEPNFSASHETIQQLDAIRNVDLLGYSGLEVGQPNGDWIL